MRELLPRISKSGNGLCTALLKDGDRCGMKGRVQVETVDTESNRSVLSVVCFKHLTPDEIKKLGISKIKR